MNDPIKNVVRDLIRRSLADKETASSFLSLIHGQPVEVVEIIDVDTLPEPERKFPDLVIREGNRVLVFEFVADNRSDYPWHVLGCVVEMAKRGLVKDCSFRVVWVGEGLPEFPTSIQQECLSMSFHVVDIREPFDARPEIDRAERQILSRLQTVHQAYGGLFTRLLQLPEPEHQRAFYEIAKRLGFQTVELEAVKESEDQCNHR